MPLKGLILLLLLKTVSCITYSPDALDYSIRSIEYESSIESGLFRCVFYDISLQNPFDNILNDILLSPRMEHILKYVITNGSYEYKHENLPWHPSMILFYPGSDVKHLRSRKTFFNIHFVLESFNPSTKLMVLVNFANDAIMRQLIRLIHTIGYYNTIFFDAVTTRADLWNTNKLRIWMKPPPPMYLFTWIRREMTGRNVTFVAFMPKSLVDLRYYTYFRWIQETARYLKTEVSEYHHNCYGLSTLTAFNKCIAKKKEEIDRVDISLHNKVLDGNITRDFGVLYTTILTRSRIAVPRDRPLNVFELMLMPFSWQVWTLLVLTFVTAEVATQFFPDLFKNDPILLAVCGFERSSLHQARQREKIILHSLIILMFFMSNAFETKIVSLMIDRPAIQRIKTLEDLINSDIKFSGDLENNPLYVNEPIVGKLVVQGKSYHLRDKVPGFGLYLHAEQAELLDVTAFDYERMQPFYVLLDCEFYRGPRMFIMSWRNRLLEAFRYIQLTLTEAGLMSLWLRQWQDDTRPLLDGRRMRYVSGSKQILSFDDMGLAWRVLAIGLGTSGAAFLWEIVQKRLGSLWNCATSKVGRFYMET